MSVDELKQSVAAASDLRENIETINEITPENIEVLLKLQNALTVVQVLASDSTNELSQVVEKDKLQQVAASSTDLSSGITVVISQVLEQQDSLGEKSIVASPAVTEEKAIQQAESIEDVPVVAEEELKQVEEVEVQTAVAMTDVVDESKEESLETLKDIDVSLTDTANEEQSKDLQSPVAEHVEVIQDNVIQKDETSEDLSKVPLVTDESKTTEGDKTNLLPKEIDTDTEKAISTQDEKATEISILEVSKQAAVVTAEEVKPVEALSNVSSPEQLIAVGNENTVCIEEDKILPINEDKINECATEIVEHVDEKVSQQEIVETQDLITEIGDVQPPKEDDNAIALIPEEVVEKPIKEVVEVKPTEAIVETKQPKEDSAQIPQEQLEESSTTAEKSKEPVPVPASAIESSAVQEQDKLDKCLPTDAEAEQIASDTTSKEIVQTAEVTETAQVEQLLEEPCSEVIVSQIDSDTDNIKQEKVESLTTENDQISTIEVEIKSETEKTESNVAQESLEQLTSENLEATPIQQELISEVIAVEAVEQQNLTETKETVISETVSELTPDAMLASVASSETVQSQVLLEENVTTSKLPEPLLEKPNENDVANQGLAVESPEVVEETKSQTLVSESLPKETPVSETEPGETQAANDIISKPDQEDVKTSITDTALAQATDVVGTLSEVVNAEDQKLTTDIELKEQKPLDEEIKGGSESTEALSMGNKLVAETAVESNQSELHEFGKEVVVEGESQLTDNNQESEPIELPSTPEVKLAEEPTDLSKSLSSEEVPTQSAEENKVSQIEEQKQEIEVIESETVEIVANESTQPSEAAVEVKQPSLEEFSKEVVQESLQQLTDESQETKAIEQPPVSEVKLAEEHKESQVEEQKPLEQEIGGIKPEMIETPANESTQLPETAVEVIQPELEEFGKEVVQGSLQQLTDESQGTKAIEQLPVSDTKVTEEKTETDKLVSSETTLTQSVEENKESQVEEQKPLQQKIEGIKPEMIETPANESTELPETAVEVKQPELNEFGKEVVQESQQQLADESQETKAIEQLSVSEVKSAEEQTESDKILPNDETPVSNEAVLDLKQAELIEDVTPTETTSAQPTEGIEPSTNLEGSVEQQATIDIEEQKPLEEEIKDVKLEQIEALVTESVQVSETSTEVKQSVVEELDKAVIQIPQDQQVKPGSEVESGEAKPIADAEVVESEKSTTTEDAVIISDTTSKSLQEETEQQPANIAFGNLINILTLALTLCLIS